ncbi:MAG TPA: hypothetical protein VGP65_09190 [Candidatus Angelobacter sp.]|jgi:hypothetical protein|nr:hypothetical protein [Candidatus Angelobacter sp.]
MLSERMVAVLSSIPYRPDADWEVNILPFGSIYWKDEMPAMGDLFDRQDDMAIIFRMFGIRMQLWDSEVLNVQDRQLWDALQRQVPDWTLFKRLILSDEQRAAREKAERQVGQAFESLGADHDETQG